LASLSWLFAFTRTDDLSVSTGRDGTGLSARTIDDMVGVKGDDNDVDYNFFKNDLRIKCRSKT